MLQTTGPYSSKLDYSCYVGTYGGRFVDLFDPSVDQIAIEDIAHGLSMICRFGGQTQQFYSVAEHCCYAHDLCQVAGPRRALAALLHDAHEAYLGDWTRPVQRLLSRAGMNHTLHDARTRLDQAIAFKFDLEANDLYADEVKRADEMLLGIEARQLMKDVSRWQLPRERAFCTLNIVSPEDACSGFLARFHETHSVLLARKLADE